MSFGARLRQQREQRQIALSTIAAQTKINPSLLDALERDDVSNWPEGIFRRAYVRAYARAIGLDGDAVVREFLEIHPDSVDVLPAGATIWPEPERTPGAQPPPRGLGRIVTTAMSAMPAVLRGAQKPDAPAAPPGRDRSPEPAPFTAPESRRPSPEPRIPSPESAAPSPEPRLSSPEPRAPNPESRDRSLEPRAPTPEPRAPNPEPRAPRPRSARVVPLARPEPALSAMAHVCSGIARVGDGREVVPLLAEAADLLEAVGLIVWFLDDGRGALVPSIVHGYSSAVLARLASVPVDAGNAVASAFRSAETAVVAGDGVTGAVVVPIVGSGGCVGVLAVELPDGGERRERVRAFATILAAQLAATPLRPGPARVGHRVPSVRMR